MFGFLALYFAAAGFLSGRRTGHIGMGAWAGAVCGLMLAVVVCVAIFTTAAQLGVREVTRSGFLGLVGMAWSALGFFTLMGAVCGALGALAATQAHPRPR